MLKIIPLYETRAVLNNWHYFTEGLNRVLEFSNDDITLDNILNGILSGNLLFWVGFMDDKYIGCCTTKIDGNYGNGNILWIENAYLKPGQPSNVLFTINNIFVSYAKKTGCKKIKFSTIRDKAFERKFKNSGWKADSVCFVMEVAHD